MGVRYMAVSSLIQLWASHYSSVRSTKEQEHYINEIYLAPWNYTEASAPLPMQGPSSLVVLIGTCSVFVMSGTCLVLSSVPSARCITCDHDKYRRKWVSPKCTHWLSKWHLWAKVWTSRLEHHSPESTCNNWSRLTWIYSCSYTSRSVMHIP